MKSIAAARPWLVLPALVALIAGTFVTEAGGQAHSDITHSQIANAPSAPAATGLMDGLGTHGYRISTEVPAAQAFFDQGLRLYYAFNHEEAIRSFREAQRLDPDCAMCWWGEALAWGPNINLPMEPESGVHAFTAVQGALARIEGSTGTEWTLIQALAQRYEAVPGPEREHLDSAWAAALESATRVYPDDPEISVLFAESRMTLRPWDYWTPEALPAGGIADALRHLEAVLEKDPDHPGACHFYIHAVEQEYPERAVGCAERLAMQMPAAGHLVHMPGHIYIRVGRYLDAIEANLHAVHADETYIRDQRPGAGMYTMGYYPHNYDFLAFAASMLGREEQTIAAADKVAELIPAEMVDVPGPSSSGSALVAGTRLSSLRDHPPSSRTRPRCGGMPGVARASPRESLRVPWRSWTTSAGRRLRPSFPVSPWSSTCPRTSWPLRKECSRPGSRLHRVTSPPRYS